MSKHVPIYRPIFKQALHTAWKHRELWPIAAVAGLAGTGVVINDLLNQAKLATALPTTGLRGLIANQQFFTSAWEQIYQVSLSSLTLSIVLSLLATIAIIYLVIACQQVMLRVVHTAMKRKSHLHWPEIREAFVHPRTWRFFTLDVFVKLFVSNLMIAASTLLVFIRVNMTFFDGLFGTIFMATVVALALVVNILVMLALIGVTRQDLSLAQALSYAWQTFKQHAAICLEMSVMLFGLNFLISTAYHGTLVIMGVPTVFTFIAALTTGSMVIYSVLVAIVAALFLTVTIAFAGFATTFTYATWVDLAERISKKAVTPRVVSHTKQLMKAWRT
jgi:hypothetical protein